jgi:ribosomal protein S18 acetylase RimI-like enzyme
MYPNGMIPEMFLRYGELADIPQIVRLLNGAYRGESSRSGWTTEADLIGGDVRTNEQDVRKVMGKSGSVFLVLTDHQNGIAGCVNLRLEEDSVYLGMFAVSPVLQGRGLGRKLMDAAEVWTGEHRRNRLKMWVISVRAELIEWYRRLGFQDTGQRIAFREDGLSGHHLRPLEFMVLEKEIAAI